MLLWSLFTNINYRGNIQLVNFISRIFLKIVTFIAYIIINTKINIKKIGKK